MSHTARSARPMSRWISWVRPDGWPSLTSRRGPARATSPGSIEYSAVTQPLAAAAHPPGARPRRSTPCTAPGCGRRHQHRAGGHLGEVALEGDGAQLVGGSAVGLSPARYGHAVPLPVGGVGGEGGADRGDRRRPRPRRAGPASGSTPVATWVMTSRSDAGRRRRRRPGPRCRCMALRLGRREERRLAQERAPIASPAATPAGPGVGAVEQRASRSPSTRTASVSTGWSVRLKRSRGRRPSSRRGGRRCARRAWAPSSSISSPARRRCPRCRTRARPPRSST